MSAYSITFTVPGIPVAQPRQRHRVVAGKGKTFVQNYTAKDSPVQAYKQAIQLMARVQMSGRQPIVGPVYVGITAVWHGPSPGPRKAPRSRQWRASKPDCDNVAKAILDAIRGVVYEDDAQVVSVWVKKVTGATGEGARTEIVIYDVD